MFNIQALGLVADVIDLHFLRNRPTFNEIQHPMNKSAFSSDMSLRIPLQAVSVPDQATIFVRSAASGDKLTHFF